MKITEFFNTDFSSFATYSAFRGIAHAVDGQKPSSRKVLCVIKDIKEKIKVSSLASRIVDTMEYIHGATSLEGVITGMAQNFTGSNNLNLLEPKGDFGSVCIPKAGASRYIYVNKEKIFDKVIINKDEPILIEQEFEGTKIEPKFYVPIIPLILVNGSEGIATGFAQKILPRNIHEIIKRIEVVLNYDVEHLPTTIKPYYKGFKGDIIKTGESSYDIIGKFERINSTTILVTELPIGYDLEKYNNILAKLEEEKVITDYIDKSEPKENKFLFEIKTSREFVKKDDDYILNKLKLIKKVSENFTCIGINNEIIEFKNEIEIFDYYVKIRLDYYKKRKEYLLSKLKEELLILGSKFFFVKLVLEGKLKVFKEKKEIILKNISSIKDYPFYQIDGSFEYLLRMPIHTFTSDTITELKNAIQKKKEELKTLEEKTIEDMWIEDLSELKKALN